MKLIPPLLLALSAAAQHSFSPLELAKSIYAPTTAHVYHEGTNGTFRVDYLYIPAFCSTPATMPPGVPHYDATVAVFTNGIQIGKSFNGVYAPGCKMCDDPAVYVHRALVEGTNSVVTNQPVKIWAYSLTNMPGPMPTTNFNIWPSIPKIQPFATFTNGVLTVYSESQITGELKMDNPNAPIHWLRLNVEIGFRPDGTVLWRATK